MRSLSVPKNLCAFDKLPPDAADGEISLGPEASLYFSFSLLDECFLPGIGKENFGMVIVERSSFKTDWFVGCAMRGNGESCDVGTSVDDNS